MLLNVTETHDKEVAKGTESASASCDASCVPKIATMLPGATVWPLTKLAAFTTPPELIAVWPKHKHTAIKLSEPAPANLLKDLISDQYRAARSRPCSEVVNFM